MSYWLIKTEPTEFNIDDLAKRPNQIEHWDGVRNYQARNTLRDSMKMNDRAFFYHSNCDEPGIVGIVKVVRESYPDHTAFDPQNKHYDSKSVKENPRWFMVDVQFEKKFNRTITLSEMRNNPNLQGLTLLRKGNRLSVMPVNDVHWKAIVSLIR